MKAISLEDIRNGLLTGQFKDEIPVLEIDKEKLAEPFRHCDLSIDDLSILPLPFNFSMGAITNEK